MDFQQVTCKRTNNSASQFWKAISIWTKNPHAVNRRISTFRELLVAEVCSNILNIFEHIFNLQIQPSDFECDLCVEGQRNLLEKLNIAEYCQLLECLDPIETLNDGKVYLCVKKLLPRNPRLFSPTIEFTFVDKRLATVTSLHKCIVQDKRSLGPDLAYRIQHQEYNCTSISIYKSRDQDYEENSCWLSSKFLPRLIKWMNGEDNEAPKVTSISLVSAERYTSLYNQLKEKYGTKMVAIWPENTDPAKFIYEDIAIATYLLLLWEKERLEAGTQRLQSFVDLGCGNGLLVYILSSEGHTGKGVDLRRRKIWDLYPQSTRLEVSTIVPSSNTVFPDVDWIIGNHSDELTPWIPVIAARSSYECRFFLLPCCAYEFDGSRYRRNNAAESQYSEYMSYVKSVCEGCGFVTQTDRLRIPSTKRTCFVGWRRNYAKEDSAVLDDNIKSIIDARTTTTTSQDDAATETTEGSDLWSTNFKPRSPTEQTRNCTQLDKNLILDVVTVVATHLLRPEHRISLEWTHGKMWNAGQRVAISELAQLLAPEVLQQMRNECGGLQTLLRNHSHIFRVAEGKVQFRIPGSNTVDKRKRKKGKHREMPVKKKPCWFHRNHPDGCPVHEVNCDFQH